MNGRAPDGITDEPSRKDRCIREINETLAAHRCGMVPRLLISQYGGITPTATVMTEEEIAIANQTGWDPAACARAIADQQAKDAAARAAVTPVEAARQGPEEPAP